MCQNVGSKEKPRMSIGERSRTMAQNVVGPVPPFVTVVHVEALCAAFQLEEIIPSSDYWVHRQTECHRPGDVGTDRQRLWLAAPTAVLNQAIGLLRTMT